MREMRNGSGMMNREALGGMKGMPKMPGMPFSSGSPLLMLVCWLLIQQQTTRL